MVKQLGCKAPFVPVSFFVGLLLTLLSSALNNLNMWGWIMMKYKYLVMLVQGNYHNVHQRATCSWIVDYSMNNH